MSTNDFFKALKINPLDLKETQQFVCSQRLLLSFIYHSFVSILKLVSGDFLVSKVPEPYNFESWEAISTDEDESRVLFAEQDDSEAWLVSYEFISIQFRRAKELRYG